MNSNDNLEKIISKAFTTSLIRFSTIAFIVFVCGWTFLPFVPLLMWALVLAIALYPVRLFIENKTGWSSTRSSTLIAITGVLLLGVPTAMIANSFTSSVLDAYDVYQSGAFTIPKPVEAVQEWPLIGSNLYEAWRDAYQDFSGFIEDKQPEIKGLLTWFVDAAGGAAKSVFLLIGAIIVAGIMLAWAQPAAKSIRQIFIRFSDVERGPELHTLTTATIRQVAIGIIGIAFLTAIVFGIVVSLAGVPAAPLLTVIALIFAICQIPVTLIAILASALLWSGEDTSTVHNTIFTILLIAASLTDNFLKPLVLGRGLDVPMPVVLIGAIGGMMSGGILGMFIGAAFLAAGYQVFMAWVDAESLTEKAVEQHIEQEKES